MPGLPKPMSTVDTIKSRRSRLDEAEAEATGEGEQPPAETPKKPEPKAEGKGLPKPGLIERAIKFIKGDK